MFTPPVYVNIPSFAIPSSVVISLALAVKFFPLFTVIELWLITVPLEFSTNPSIIKCPNPLISLLFFPPVYVNTPAFAMPVVIFTFPAFAVNEEFDSISNLCCSNFASSPKLSIAPLLIVVEPTPTIPPSIVVVPLENCKFPIL